MEQHTLHNSIIKKYNFLKEMYQDNYFPNDLVDKGKIILLQLCQKIELQEPKELSAFYELTHAATEQFNDLEEEFGDAGSEIETAAREAIALDFNMIALAYGYEADIEEMIAPREW